MLFKKKPLGTCVALALGATLGVQAFAAAPGGSGGTKEITLIHMGDLHGHLIPRPNLRSDGDGRMEGGLARMYTEIESIRSRRKDSILINTGDTTQGSGEALYTEGQAMLDVIDMFDVNAFAPGNWEFVYGPERFEDEFGTGTGKNGNGNRWGALASNLYRTATDVDAAGFINGPRSEELGTGLFSANKVPATLARVHTSAQYDAWATWYKENGSRILPPTAIKTIGDVKVGIVGCTTRRGPQVVGKWVTQGIEFTDCAKEVPDMVAKVRSEGAEIVVLITEIEVGANIQMVSTFDSLDGDNHIDVILNSDMHEETIQPIEIPNKSRTRNTILIEEGQDGTMIGELTLEVTNGALSEYQFKAHRISDKIKEDAAVAAKVAEVRAPFNDGFDATIPCNEDSPYWSKLNNSCLVGPLNAEVGTTTKALHRSGFTDEHLYSNDPDAMPAVIEGSSHDWVADAIRWWAKSDTATVRGFRYGQHIAPGPITRNDLYHIVPIAARIGKAGKIHANQVRNQMDNSSMAVFSTNPLDTNVKAAPYNNEGWAGGWMFAYSGPKWTFDPYWVRKGTTDSRSRGITVTMPCDRLPSVNKTVPAPTTEDPNNKISEKDACIANGTGKAVTVINDSRTSEDALDAGAYPGDWTPAWKGQVFTVTSTNPTPFSDLVINDEYGTANYGKWSSVSAPNGHNKENHRPIIEVAGYYFGNAPYTLNNCPNCNPRGTSPIVEGEDVPADAPYLLPVNMDPDTGRAMIDASGRPTLETVEVDGVTKTKWENGHPVSAGVPIDLTVVLEKYLNDNPPELDPQNPTVMGEVRTEADEDYDAERGRGPANPVAHRVSLQKPLPGRDAFGFPVMQPLCGTVASYFSKPNPDAYWGDNNKAGFGERIMAEIPECPTP